MAVRLRGMWRLDYDVLEIGDRIELYDLSNLLLCRLVSQSVRFKVGGASSMEFLVEGPDKLLERLVNNLSEYDRNRIANLLFYFNGVIEEGAELSFFPIHSPGTSLGFVANVARVVSPRAISEQVPVPSYDIPEVQQA